MKVKDVPVIFLKDGLYYIGVYKVLVEMQCDYLVVKVGNAKFERFSEFIKANREQFTKILTILSIKNNNSTITEVTSKLIKGNTMEGLNNSFVSNMTGNSFMRNRDNSIGSIRNSVRA